MTVTLRRQMAQLVDYLRSAIPALFGSDDYRAKVGAIEETFSKQQERVFKELGEDAERQNIVLLRTPGGFAFAPTHNQEVLAPDDYNELKERSEQVAQFNRETTRATVQHVIIEHADDFRHPEETTKVSGLTLTTRETFHRYQVNLLVTNGKQAGALGRRARVVVLRWHTRQKKDRAPHKQTEWPSLAWRWRPGSSSRLPDDGRVSNPHFVIQKKRIQTSISLNLFVFTGS